MPLANSLTHDRREYNALSRFGFRVQIPPHPTTDDPISASSKFLHPQHFTPKVPIRYATPMNEFPVISVTELVTAFKEVVETALPPCSVEGEISNCRMSPAGHWYLTLKDATSEISADRKSVV